VNSEESVSRLRLAFERHSSSILGYSIRRTRSAQDAADVLAETMVVAWRRVEEMPEEPETILWLYGIARNVQLNLARGELRRNRLSMKMSHLLDEVVPPADEIQLENATDVRRALESLSENEREVLVLTAVEGLSPSEIASLLDMNASTVRTHLHRARESMRALLDSQATTKEESGMWTERDVEKNTEMGKRK
jgi:RNA polymerase sigma factor (sigma-70 family)